MNRRIRWVGQLMLPGVAALLLPLVVGAGNPAAVPVRQLPKVVAQRDANYAPPGLKRLGR